MKHILIYHNSLNINSGGGGWLPMLLLSELQNKSKVTLALNWESDLQKTACHYTIPLDISKIEVVIIRPHNNLIRCLDVNLPFYRSWKLRELAKSADVCISTSNLMDFGKPAHQFICSIDFGDNAFQDFVRKTHKKPFPRLYQRFRTYIAEHFLRPLLGLRSARQILIDRHEHIYPNSIFVSKLMQLFYGSLNSQVFYPPTLFELSNMHIERNPLQVIYIGRICAEKRLTDIIEIVDMTRKLTHTPLNLILAGYLPHTTYVKEIKRITSINEWIQLIGPVFGSSKESLLLASTYAIHSERDEAFGISVTEYLKAGLISIVPDEGGTPEIVDSPALTYHTNEEAAQILSHLLCDQAFREEQHRHCEERAKLFSREAYMEQQHQLLDSILQE